MSDKQRKSARRRKPARAVAPAAPASVAPATAAEPLRPMTADQLGELLDVFEAARYTHLQHSTIRSWLFQRRIPHVKLGRRVFVRKSDLDRLIESSLVPAVTVQAVP